MRTDSHGTDCFLNLIFQIKLIILISYGGLIWEQLLDEKYKTSVAEISARKRAEGKEYQFSICIFVILSGSWKRRIDNPLKTSEPRGEQRKMS